MRTRRFSSSGDPVGGTPASTRASEPTRGGHRTVLLHEAVDALNVKSGSTTVDATLGAGGHGKEIAKRLGARGTLIGFDADAEALQCSRKRLEGTDAKLFFIHANFRELEARVHKLGIKRVDGVLFDLG